MRRGALAVEQSGGGQHERAGAHRHQPRPAGVRRAQRVEHRRRWRLVEVAPVGDDDRAGARQRSARDASAARGHRRWPGAAAGRSSPPRSRTRARPARDAAGANTSATMPNSNRLRPSQTSTATRRLDGPGTAAGGHGRILTLSCHSCHSTRGRAPSAHWPRMSSDLRYPVGDVRPHPRRSPPRTAPPPSPPWPRRRPASAWPCAGLDRRASSTPRTVPRAGPCARWCTTWSTATLNAYLRHEVRAERGPPDHQAVSRGGVGRDAPTPTRRRWPCRSTCSTRCTGAG